VLQDLLAHRASKVFRDYRGLQEILVLRVLRVMLVLQDLLDHRASKVFRVFKVFKVK
jgi:hypothetical protein